MVATPPLDRTGVRYDGERGFTLVELLIATFVGTIVLGAGVTLMSQVQRGYTSQLDNAGFREEARFAVDWITRDLMSAGSNPYGITHSDCPDAGTSFVAVRPDPNQNGSHEDIRINADAGLPNGLLGGTPGICDEPHEDITIAFDPSEQTITRRDNNVDQQAQPMTDSVITDLEFTYLDSNGAVTNDPAAIVAVRVGVSAQGRVRNTQTAMFPTFTAQTEVYLRAP
jgi:prepilin-type N-terminal cleavage/methylation domain-containing protein